MRISLFLNSTMSKRCVQPQKKDWLEQEREPPPVHPAHGKKGYLFEDSSSKHTSSFHSRTMAVNHLRAFPAFLTATNELQWFINSRSTLSQALDAGVRQIYSLSTLLLFYLIMVLLLAQVAGLAFLLSCAVSLPAGLQFMLASVFLIVATAFKIMHSLTTSSQKGPI